MSKLFIGTSGWIYGHWDGVFYPEDLPYKEKLKYYAEHFKTAEVNYSFYHLPRPQTFKNWQEQTPEDFVFAVKASRFITHIKRLKGVKMATRTFLENAQHLGKKLGPILFQFPPGFKATEENIVRLKNFLKFLSKFLYYSQNKRSPILVVGNSKKVKSGRRARFAFEFRHESWFIDKVYKLLKKYRVALCVADSPRYPKEIKATCNFVYIRMHGSKQLFSSKYTKKELEALAKLIKKFLKQKKDVYVYFNNDAHGYAVENAKELLKILA